jgi:hypothetical protein
MEQWNAAVETRFDETTSEVPKGFVRIDGVQESPGIPTISPGSSGILTVGGGRRPPIRETLEADLKDCPTKFLGHGKLSEEGNILRVFFQVAR